jgi:Outer membrane protein beta-barrel domain
MPHRLTSFAATIGLLALMSTIAGAASSIVLPRPGQVGFSIQGEYGSLLKSGDLGEFFGTGPGLAVRLKYRMRYERAIGLSFEGQQLDSRTPGIAGDTTASRVSLNLAGVEVYQMFGTVSTTTRMVTVGAGIAHPTVKLDDGETTFPDDGVYVSAGAGLEHFFYRSWGLDVSGRYHAIFQHGKTNHDFQAAAGFVFYASY